MFFDSHKIREFAWSVLRLDVNSEHVNGIYKEIFGHEAWSDAECDELLVGQLQATHINCVRLWMLYSLCSITCRCLLRAAHTWQVKYGYQMPLPIV